MKIYTGKGIFGGIAIGKIHVYERHKCKVSSAKSINPNGELRRYKLAKTFASEQLDRLYTEAATEIGLKDAAIFKMQKAMLEDVEYTSEIEDLIVTKRYNAEYAASKSAENFVSKLKKLDNDYIRARASDVTDVSERLLKSFRQIEENPVTSPKHVIIVADDLTPCETFKLNLSNILAFVTKNGSPTSHTAILAAARKIPGIVGADISNLSDLDGKLAIIDSYEGKIYIEPNIETFEKMRAKQQQMPNKRMKPLKPQYYANIGSPNEIDGIVDGILGIGLFRTEFLFLQQPPPDEETQVKIYRDIAQKMKNKPVVIRIADLGGDKQNGRISEENPAMGVRGIRYYRRNQELLRTQIRAIYRAGICGNVSILFPMITSLNELLEVKAIMSEVKTELITEGKRFADVSLGIMIETPSSAIISDMLARHVDFFSIGTNDLSQFTLAADRNNHEVSKLFNDLTAVKRLVETVVQNAEKFGVDVTVCGEMASDPKYSKFFKDIGVSKLSVSSSKIAP